MCHFGRFIITDIDCQRMTTKATPESDGNGETEVMAAIDGDGTQKRVIIADITRDGAWLAVPLSEAASLPAWR